MQRRQQGQSYVAPQTTTKTTYRQPKMAQQTRRVRQEQYVEQVPQYVEEQYTSEEDNNTDLPMGMGLVTALVGLGVIVAGGYYISRKMNLQKVRYLDYNFYLL
jgi:hypothetical protein